MSPPVEPTSRPAGIGRRQFVAMSAAVTVAAPILAAVGLPTDAAAAGVARGPGSGGPPTRPQPAGRLTTVDSRLNAPVARAYHYLDVTMDAYATGDTLRLLQSYNNESGLLTTAFVYDNALAVMAYLRHPTPSNVRRAKIIGDTFLWIQANDERFRDGRVRQAYAAGPMTFYGGGPTYPGIRRADGHAAFLAPFGFSGSAVGDMAWVGLSLLHLYAHTGERKYLAGATALGTWIATGNVSPYRYGGYLGGVQADGTTRQRWTSTEHNADAYALFRLLARFTRQGMWLERATRARGFVRAMWQPAGRFFATGTLGGLPGEDPNSINLKTVPEDVQTWPYLALADRRYAVALDWVRWKLATTDRGGDPALSEVPPDRRISGVAFGDTSKSATGLVPESTRRNNRNAVWLEGNSHLAAALLARGRADNDDDRNGRQPDRWHRAVGDRQRAVHYLLEAVVAQNILGGGQTVGLTTDPAGGRLSNPGEGGTWTGTPLPARCGIVAASSAFDTGFGYGYFQRQHVGATSWFIIAALRGNPFQI